jgi:hypothetical protein
MKTIKFLATLIALLGVCIVVSAQTRKPVKSQKSNPVSKKAPSTKATPVPQIKEKNSVAKPDFNQDDVSFLFFLLKNYPSYEYRKDELEFKLGDTAYQCKLRIGNTIVIDAVRDTSQTDPDGGQYNSGFIIDMSNLNVLLSYFSKNETLRIKRAGDTTLYNSLIWRRRSFNPVAVAEYFENAENLKKEYPGIRAMNGLISASQTPHGFVSLKDFFSALQRRYDVQKNAYDRAKGMDAGTSSSKSAADLLVWSQSEREGAIKFVLSKMQPLFYDEPSLGIGLLYQQQAWQKWRDKWDEGIQFENGGRSFKVTYGDYKRRSIQIDVKWMLHSGPGTGIYTSRYKFNTDGSIEESFYAFNDKGESLKGIVRPSFANKNPGDFISPDAALLIVKEHFGNR